MIEWFLNPGFLALAAALVGVPIIIHLINRMRFKRVRWAAMEFLLKAQKRMRRRLIIEQMLLLFLRCLLVALVGLLVSRYLGGSDLASKQGTHVVILDDTLSMNDAWKDNGAPKQSFDYAKKEIVLDKIAKALGQANANDKLMLVPIAHSVLKPDDWPKSYGKLSDENRFKSLKADLDSLQPTMLHASVQPAVKAVQDLITNNPGTRVTLHVVGDFRQKDWAKTNAESLHQMLQSMAKASRDVKIRLIDVAHPFWAKGQGNPLSHDNVGILDLRAGTRVAGKDMPVAFTATIANFSGREAEVHLSIFDETGSERHEINFSPTMPLKISPASSKDVTFEMRFSPNIKAGETHFAKISAHLKSSTMGDLENDGLSADNVRFASVEVRDKVPVLVIDGEGSRSRTEFDKDSFFLQTALSSVPGASYELVWGDELGGGVAAKALERPDLNRYPTIFLMNVRDLSPKQLTNLENYARDGGGVCFFLGPQVSPKFYNEKLYAEGKGVFPMPLKDGYTPPPSEEPRRPEFTGLPQVLLRSEPFGKLESMPIFGPIFGVDSEQLKVLKDLPIRRYFQTVRSQWKAEPGRVFELVTLPNESPIASYDGAVLNLMNVRLEKIMNTEDGKKARKGLEKHRRNLISLVQPGTEKLAYHLGPALNALLTDPGDKKNPEDAPNLEEFWKSADPTIGTLRGEIETLRDQVRYGDPLVVAANVGKGKVIAVTTTAGKDWNDWAGGSEASLVYPAVIWELQSYLSSRSVDENPTVGTSQRLTLDAESFKGKSLKARRLYSPLLPDKDAAGDKAAKGTKTVDLGESFPVEAKGQLIFDFPRNEKPGVYETIVRIDGNTRPVAVQGQAFNVDTGREGNLERVSRDEIDRNLIGDYKEQIQFDGPAVSDDTLVSRESDLSKSPWLYLILLFVLVGEQALAVHLSFHLKGNETEMLTQVARGS